MNRLIARARFDRIAELYDRTRPGYPAEMFDEIAVPGSRVLEIGCGTGQASLPLVERGCRLLAVELGEHMAELAARKLAPYPSAEVVVADFDTWETDDTGFDMVFSATAFHWLDPATKFERTADLLRPGGILATATTYQIAGGTERFFADAQACRRRFDPTTEDFTLPSAADLPPDNDLGPRYRKPVCHQYEWTVDYTTAQYLDLHRTYSAMLMLPEIAAEGLLRCFGALIEGRYGGRVTKRYLTELRIAERA